MWVLPPNLYPYDTTRANFAQEFRCSLLEVGLDHQWAESCYQAARQHVLRKTPLAESHREIYLALERGESAKDLAMRFNVSPAAIRQIRHRIEQAINAYARTLSDA